MPTLTRPQVLAIVQAGDPVLLQRTRELDPAEIGSTEVQCLIEDMDATCGHARGFGLAAPQVGQSISLFVFRPAETRAEYRNVATTAAINPRVIRQSEAQETDWEGCLSIPGYAGLVTRPAEIDVEYLDADGQPVRASLKHFAARVFLHEYDHLQGVLYTMKDEHDRSSFCTNAERARMEARTD